MPDAGDVRLGNRYYGPVYVFLSTQWVAVAKSIPWTLENAQVVCRELGYDLNGDPPTMINSFCLSCCFSTGTTLRGGITYFRYSALEQMDNVVCTGTESELKDCRHDIHFLNTIIAVGTDCGYC